MFKYSDNFVKILINHLELKTQSKHTSRNFLISKAEPSKKILRPLLLFRKKLQSTLLKKSTQSGEK